MSTSTIQKDLVLSENLDTIIYEFGVVQQMIYPEETVKNRITATIEKTFIQKDDIGYLYNVQISDRNQVNLEDMLGLENELSFLQKNITLYTNAQGEIISILNRGEINEDWYDQAKLIKKEYSYLTPDIDPLLSGIEDLIKDNDSFVSLIKKSEIYSALFPPIYNQDLEKKITLEQEKDFDNFFDTTTLPLIVTTALTGINAITNGKQIIRSGKIDNYRFNKESASELFTKAYGVTEYALNFDASYIETFDLDQNNQVDKVNIMLGVKVNDLYQLKQISKLKKKN